MPLLSLGQETSGTVLQVGWWRGKWSVPCRHPACWLQEQLPSCVNVGTSSWHTGESLPSLSPTSSRKPVRGLNTSWDRLSSASSKPGAAVGPPNLPLDGSSLRAGLYASWVALIPTSPPPLQSFAYP